MWYQHYLIKQATLAVIPGLSETLSDVSETLMGPGGLSEWATAPPLMVGESLAGKRLDTKGTQGKLLAFIDPGIYFQRVSVKRKHPEWFKEE